MQQTQNRERDGEKINRKDKINTYGSSRQKDGCWRREDKDRDR